MEEKIGLVLILVYISWFFSAQIKSIDSTNQELRIIEEKQVQQVQEHEQSVRHTTLTQEKMHSLIKKVGEQEEWIMTEFKNNAILAEKNSEDKTIFLTIKFNKSSFDISPENDGFKKAMNTALNI